jgi:hypothetical protein
VIPVRNDAVRLGACLESIARGTPAGVPVEVVVADNGSTDDSVGVARGAGAEVLELPGARLGELRNRAAAHARGSILAFVDADHEIAPAWIPAAIETLSGAAAAVGAPCYAPSPGTWVQRCYDRLRRHPAAQEPVEWLGSGNLAVRREAFEAAGGFDVSLETCEDVDLCRKLRAGGGVLVADHRMRNVHHGDPRTLGQVFVGELWRGRDNLRVSLRAPRTGRTLASAAIPVVNLAAAVTGAVGLATMSPAGATVAGAAAALLLLTVGLRTARMLNGGSPAAPMDWPRAFAVAAAYEGGRALASVGRVGYRRRRAATA